MIKTVRITNFKSLADVTVSLEPVTVLIGKSGTGKTNFLQAMRFLRDYLQHRNFREADYGGWARIFSATATQPQMLSFEITFDAPGVKQNFQYKVLLKQQGKNSPSAPTLHEERLALGEQVIFHACAEKWVVPPPMVAPPPSQGLKLGALTGVASATTAHIVLSKGIGVYTFPDSVLLAQLPQMLARRRTGESGNQDRTGQRSAT